MKTQILAPHPCQLFLAQMLSCVKQRLTRTTREVAGTRDVDMENIPFFIGFDRASSWNIPLFHRCFKLLAHFFFPKGAFCSSSPIECFRKSLYVVEVIEQVFIHQESGMNRELYLPGN